MPIFSLKASYKKVSDKSNSTGQGKLTPKEQTLKDKLDPIFGRFQFAYVSADLDLKGNNHSNVL